MELQKCERRREELWMKTTCEKGYSGRILTNKDGNEGAGAWLRKAQIVVKRDSADVEGNAGGLAKK